MEKEKNLQLELFSQPRDSKDIRGRTLNSAFFGAIRTYEKRILLIIGIIITSIISYSLGVEKGKNLSISKTNAKLDLALKTTAPIEQPTLKKAVKEEEYKGLTVTSPKGIITSSYTIQLASYKTRSYAQKEAEILKKKGLSPLVLSKGGYAVLCVGNFSNKEMAEPLVSELKKRYIGCYIRRL